MQLVDNHLFVDGRPFFFHACWHAPGNDFAGLRRHHVNATAIRLDQAWSYNQAAADEGLLILPFALKPDTLLAHLDRVESLAATDWVLAWVIGDDLVADDTTLAIAARESVRVIDAQQRPTTLDALSDYAEFATMTPHAIAAVDAPAELIMLFDKDGHRAHDHGADGPV